jgi:hypothetical protein
MTLADCPHRGRLRAAAPFPRRAQAAVTMDAADMTIDRSVPANTGLVVAAPDSATALNRLMTGRR